jgi:hypothetical protein
MSQTTKLKYLKLANAVKTGKGEAVFLTSDHFDMRIHSGVFVEIYHLKSGVTVHTSLFNAIYWETLPAEGQVEQAPTKRGPGRPPKEA